MRIHIPKGGVGRDAVPHSKYGFHTLREPGFVVSIHAEGVNVRSLRALALQWKAKTGQQLRTVVEGDFIWVLRTK